MTVPSVTRAMIDASNPGGVAVGVPLAVDADGAALLRVDLPTGAALLAELLTPAAGGTLDVLEAELGGAANDAWIRSALLPVLPGGASVTLATLIPTQSPASGEPIVISGTSPGLTNEAPRIALVIDGGSLPLGSSIRMDNIEFAAIIGNAHVTGGDGANIVVADDDPQYIVLGEGDDALYGGGGNDIIGSASGDDRLHGDQGDDLVFGGEGDDTLWGGAGNDYLDGQAGSDTASYTDATAGVRVSLEKKGWQQTGGSGTDRLTHIEHLTGSDFDDRLTGDRKDNVLQGGTGNDVLKGGRGNDRFVYAAPGEGGDTIAGFRSGSDQLVFDGSAFGGLAAGELAAAHFAANRSRQAQDAEDRFIFDSANRKLYFDADGSGQGAAELVATLVGGGVIRAGDILIV